MPIFSGFLSPSLRTFLDSLTLQSAKYPWQTTTKSEDRTIESVAQPNHISRQHWSHHNLLRFKVLKNGMQNSTSLCFSVCIMLKTIPPNVTDKLVTKELLLQSETIFSSLKKKANHYSSKNQSFCLFWKCLFRDSFKALTPSMISLFIAYFFLALIFKKVSESTTGQMLEY